LQTGEIRLDAPEVLLRVIESFGLSTVQTLLLLVLIVFDISLLGVAYLTKDCDVKRTMILYFVFLTSMIFASTGTLMLFNDIQITMKSYAHAPMTIWKVMKRKIKTVTL
jgi:hypothetical protein